ncbi:MAG TPA: hypothetical protein VF984_02900 [Actinomycetota bacterium]
MAAFIVLMGVLAVFAGIAPAFPTTEESFFKIGAIPEVKGVVLAAVGAVLIAGGYFLTRFAGKIYQ